MFNASCALEKPASRDAEKIVQLTFPIALAPAAVPASPREPRLRALEGPYLALPAHPAAAEAPPISHHDGGEAWQVRVDMTLADAEELIEGLRSLIAVARESLQARQAAQPAALAFAGLKIGAETKPAPPRFSHAQLEALSRMPIRRGLNLGPDGRLVQALTLPAKLQPQSARLTG